MAGSPSGKMTSMATKGIYEPGRAAALAAHSAAGLSVGLPAGKGKSAARMFRSAEALCRAAVAALVAEFSCETKVDKPAAQCATRRRQRKKKQKAGEQETAAVDGHGQGAPGGGDMSGIVPAVVVAPSIGDEVMVAVGPLEHAVGQVVSTEEGTGRVLVDLISAGGPGDKHSSIVVNSSDLGTLKPDVHMSLGTPELAPASPSAVGKHKSVGKSPGQNIRKAKFYCTCGFSRPLSKSLRCGGCQWLYQDDQLRGLRSEAPVQGA